ncbi:MAG: DUF4179 domain-containing protein [Oscillospiraceae bacterium]|nr:DUF4179 domain-containing protein [Oscillospiraceae bacterium]
MSMFDEFLRNCQPEDEITPSKERVEKNISAVMSLIKTKDAEENDMTKRKVRLKPLIIAAVIAIFSGVLLLSVSAAIQVSTVNFFMGGKELDGEYYDYVDSKGIRHISFNAVLPLDEHNFAIIYDIDAPMGENVRVITDETDPEFMDKLRQYKKAVMGDSDMGGGTANISDFGITLKDSELLTYTLKTPNSSFGGTRGGNFMHTELSRGKPSGFNEEYTYDYENRTKTFKETFYYYVGKE